VEKRKKKTQPRFFCGSGPKRETEKKKIGNCPCQNSLPVQSRVFLSSKKKSLGTKGDCQSFARRKEERGHGRGKKKERRRRKNISVSKKNPCHRLGQKGEGELGFFSPLDKRKAVRRGSLRTGGMAEWSASILNPTRKGGRLFDSTIRQRSDGLRVGASDRSGERKWNHNTVREGNRPEKRGKTILKA